LGRKGIDAEVVEQVLAEFVDVGTEETAFQLLSSQAQRYRGMEEMRAKRRMYGLLARRGFDSDTASRAVDQAWAELVRGP
jgi:regulatory protein